MLDKLLFALRSALADSVRVSLDLFKVMVPIIAAVKILKELDLIRVLALPLEPLMGLVGLPASLGLAWAAALLNNIYAGMIVFVSLAPAEQLSTAQATVFCVLMLLAHNLPVEGKVAQQCGPALWTQLAVRFFGALACGMLLHWTYAATHTLQAPARILFAPAYGQVSLWAWAIGEMRNLAAIFCIILGLMLLMRALSALGVTRLLNTLLKPVLRRMGIGPEASTITIFGLALGLTYGSGLIINEVRSGRVGMRDTFHAVSFMGLTHALIEDTLLMTAIGGHLSGVLWGRLLFSLLALLLLVRATSRMDDARFRARLMSRT